MIGSITPVTMVNGLRESLIVTAPHHRPGFFIATSCINCAPAGGAFRKSIEEAARRGLVARRLGEAQKDVLEEMRSSRIDETSAPASSSCPISLAWRAPSSSEMTIHRLFNRRVVNSAAARESPRVPSTSPLILSSIRRP